MCAMQMLWLLRAVSVSLALFASTRVCVAQEYSWNNLAGGAWHDAANWSPTGVPNSAKHSALFGGATAYVVVLDDQAVVKDLQLLTSSPKLEVSGAALIVAGKAMVNNGTITLNPNGSTPFSFLAHPIVATILGTGAIVLNASSNQVMPRILHYNSNSTTTIAMGQTIRGTGHLYAGVFVNEGTVQADQNGKMLDCSGCVLSGPGEYVALNGGVLSLNSATLDGVSLATRNGGVVKVQSTSYASSVTIKGALEIWGGEGLIVEDGRLTNDGTMTINPTGLFAASTWLMLASDGTLDGTGTVMLNATNDLDEAHLLHFSDTTTTTIATGQTIQGAGRLSHGVFNLNGTINPGRTVGETRPIDFAGCAVNCGASFDVCVELGGSAPVDHDRITGDAVISLDGTLTLSYIRDWTPKGHERLEFIRGSAVKGTFAQAVFNERRSPTGPERVVYTPTSVIVAMCFADTDANGLLNIDDFTAFQAAYASGDSNADCDQSGSLDIDDCICFQTAYALGC